MMGVHEGGKRMGVRGREKMTGGGGGGGLKEDGVGVERSRGLQRYVHHELIAT